MGSAATKPANPGWRFASQVAPTMTSTEITRLMAKRSTASHYHKRTAHAPIWVREPAHGSGERAPFAVDSSSRGAVGEIPGPLRYKYSMADDDFDRRRWLRQQPSYGPDWDLAIE